MWKGSELPAVTCPMQSSHSLLFPVTNNTSSWGCGESEPGRVLLNRRNLVSFPRVLPSGLSSPALGREAQQDTTWLALHA